MAAAAGAGVAVPEAGAEAEFPPCGVGAGDGVGATSVDIVWSCEGELRCVVIQCGGCCAACQPVYPGGLGYTSHYLGTRRFEGRQEASAISRTPLSRSSFNLSDLHEQSRLQ